MLSKELLHRIRRIQLHAGQMVSEALAGEYLSAFRGQGLEFDEVREYHPGDDIRMIDWNVTARMNQPFVKVFKEEREMTMMLLVDASSSQLFSSSKVSKQEASAELAAVLAFLAIRNNDKVGLVVFSDHIENYIPPKKGRGHVWHIIRSVMSHKDRGGRTDIAGALAFAQSVLHRRATVFLLSDFIDDRYQDKMKQVARRHDLVCAHIYDPAEEKLPDAGVTLVKNLEGKGMSLFNTSSSKGRKVYEEAFQKRVGDLDQLTKSHGIGQFRVNASLDLLAPVERFFRERKKRRRR